MLTLADIRRVLADTDWVPGWSVTVEDSPEGPMVVIEATTVNSRQPGPIDLRIETWPSPNDRECVDAFLVWLDWRLQRVANHESREFLRHLGRLVNDPHSETRGS